MNKRIVLALLALALTLGFGKAFAEDKAHDHKHDDAMEFTVVGIEYQGSRIWVPGTLIVEKGKKVRIKIINNIKSDPNTHGFAIDAYNVKEVVARGEPKTVEFKADKAGLFTIYCQLHPAHVGGQLLVLK